MSEMVMVAPILLLVLVLLFYFGALMPRTQRASMMARYETWRDAEVDAPGPASGVPGDHAQLNETFFEGYARSIEIPLNDGYFPDDAPDTFVALADDAPGGAGRLADAWVRLPGGSPRQTPGRRELFEVLHGADLAMWDRLIGEGGDDIDTVNPERTPLVRAHVRIAGDWSYTEDWRAAADGWPRLGDTHPHHLRALRDAFLEDFDRELDEIDGDTAPEYAAEPSGAEVWTDRSLAGLIRGLYLRAHPYIGPRIDAP
jgi:hypothetical protein